MSQIGLVEGNCPTCSAPTNVNPEDIIIICEFCGTAFSTSFKKIENHFIFPPKADLQTIQTELIDKINKKLKFRGVKVNQSITLEKVFVPFWLVKLKADTHYEGYRRESRTKTRTVTRNGKTETETEHITVYVPVSRNINETRIIPVLSRRSKALFGVKGISNRLIQKINTEQPMKFSKDLLLDEVERIKFLKAELNQYEGKETGETVIQDEHRSRASKDTTELFDCRTSVNVLETILLHYPIINAEYTVNHKTFRVVLDGTTSQILSAEYPITLRYKSLAVSILSILVLVPFIVYAYLEQTGRTISDVLLFITVVGGVIAFFVNYKLWQTESREVLA